MAVEFIIENGTGLADATSYVSIDEFRQYWENNGVDFSTTPDDTIKIWLNKATEFVELQYNFKNCSTNLDQALSWPRINMLDRKGRSYFASDEIPEDLKKCVSYLAGQLEDDPDFFQEVTGLKSYRYGPVSKTFNTQNAVRKFDKATKYIDYMILLKTWTRVN